VESREAKPLVVATINLSTENRRSLTRWECVAERSKIEEMTIAAFSVILFKKEKVK